MTDIETRASRLLQELYPSWYRTHRHGARLRLIANSLAFMDACSLCETWDDKRLAELAYVFLTTDDEWIAKTDRSFRIFAMKASWCDNRLAEATRGERVQEVEAYWQWQCPHTPRCPHRAACGVVARRAS